MACFHVILADCSKNTLTPALSRQETFAQLFGALNNKGR